MTLDAERAARQRLRSLVNAASKDEAHEWVWSSDSEHWLVSAQWAETALPSVQAAFALDAQKLYTAAVLEGAVAAGWRVDAGRTYLRQDAKSVWPVLNAGFGDFTVWVPGGAETDWKPAAQRKVFVSKVHRWSEELQDWLVELPFDFGMFDGTPVGPEPRARRLLEAHRDSKTCVLLVDATTESFSRVKVWSFETADIEVPNVIETDVEGDIVLRDNAGKLAMTLTRFDALDDQADYTAHLPLSRMRCAGSWTLEER